jgi:hypothetical protein
MYIEYKGDGLRGPARIGRVSFSKRGKTIYYGGKRFQNLKRCRFQGQLPRPRDRRRVLDLRLQA